MKWFTDLAVLGKSDALEKLIPAIESRLPQDAHRDLEAESKVIRRSNPRFYCIRYGKISGDIGFVLTKYENEDVVAVDNIFIYPGKCISAPEYSALLADFFWRIVKPAADQLGLKYFSSGFEDRCPEWAKHRRRSAMEIALGFAVVWRLREEGYLSRFPVRDEFAGVPIEQKSIARRLLEIYPSCQN